MCQHEYLPESEGSSTNSPLADVCPVPDPFETDEQWDTYYHRDVLGMSALELRLARARLLMRLANERRPDPWLLERLDALEGRVGHER